MKQIIEKLFQKEVATSTIDNPEPMLALSVSAGIVKATIWELQGNNIEILGVGTKSYSDSGKEKDVDYKILLEKAADAIDMACTVAEVDVKKTMFGLPQSWIINEQLLPEYDDLMEQLAKDLDLVSVAYVSIPHAISYYLQYLHKTQPTTLMVGSSREGGNISYVENGKIKESHYISWTGESLGKNIDRGLAQFKSLHTFPSSICLYGYGDLSEARNELAKYAWNVGELSASAQSTPTFLHAPKVMVLEEHVDSLAVSLIAGKDFARLHGIQGRLMIKSLEYQDMNSAAITPEESHLPSIPEVVSVPIAAAANPHTEGTPFGFVMNKDVIGGSAPEPALESEIEPESEIEHIHEESDIEVHDWKEESEVIEEESVERPWQKPFGSKAKFTLPVFTMPGILKGRKTSQVLTVIAVILIVLIAGSSVAGWALWNIPKATVMVYVKPDVLEKQITITASEKATVSGTDNTLPSQRISIELKDIRQADTTGTRPTGQVAKGQAFIYNKTGSEKSFSANSELRSGNIKFTTTESVTIASASAQTTASGETKTNGKSSVNVTATDIGPEGNIAKDTSMTVTGYTKDDFEAIAIAAFTGGSKKDIRVVAAADRTNLSRDLKSDIELKIPSELRSKVPEDSILLDKAWTIAQTVEKFNKNINDESNTVSDEITMKVEGFMVKRADVEQILANIQTAAVPEGYEFKDNSKDIRTDFVSLDKSGKLTFTATSKANIIPKINEKQIAKDILGKSEDAARKTILSNSKVLDVSFQYTVNLPSPLLTLPHVESNIDVKRGVR
ncbi:MAG: hypothetical protein M3Q44_05735 [bacterium]|nr:hypothetical protein [bacterium]